MTIQITIIGLGQIGSSVGLALADHKDKIHRLGHDIEPGVARAALKMGAVDKTVRNLFQAVEKADMVLLAIPLDQIYETLSLIANDLRDDVVIMDTAPVKSAVITWASKLLPPERHFVGLTPVINPLYLMETTTGIEAARADLFKDGLMAIVPGAGAHSAAVKLAIDLTTLIGASPLFVDALEVDGFMAATHLLPQLVSAALLNATVDEPGWRDGGKFAGRAYAQLTSLGAAGDTPPAMVRACLDNPDNMVRVLDNLVGSLNVLKSEIITGGHESLETHIVANQESRQSWWEMRLAADWAGAGVEAAEVPTASDMISRMFFGGASRRKKDK
jgi:prephenate dehydrogenase